MGADGYFQDQYGSGDDLFATYINLDKIPLLETSEDAQQQHHHHHHRCNSESNNSYSSAPTDLNRTGRDVVLEAKKAMPSDKLAELWTIDPKRAKRILANRQSAARSKERKARYITELEMKLRTLQTEATTLSAQLGLFQRDTTGLMSENNELKLKLQAMEQQAELQDALNEALMQEVERLKMATGELIANVNSNLSNDQLNFTTPNLVQTSSYTLISPYQTSAAPPTKYCHTMLGLAEHDYATADEDDRLSQLQVQDGVGLISSVVGAAIMQSHVVKSDVHPCSLSGTESSTTC